MVGSTRKFSSQTKVLLLESKVTLNRESSSKVTLCPKNDFQNWWSYNLYLLTPFSPYPMKIHVIVLKSHFFCFLTKRGHNMSNQIFLNDQCWVYVVSIIHMEFWVLLNWNSILDITYGGNGFNPKSLKQLNNM
jgi:hypothetical protein